jgi:hypothetical protein
MLEYWNDGMAPFGQINACGGDGWDQRFTASFSIDTAAILILRIARLRLRLRKIPAIFRIF